MDISTVREAARCDEALKKLSEIREEMADPFEPVRVRVHIAEVILEPEAVKPVLSLIEIIHKKKLADLGVEYGDVG